jgi:hypothetical protein
MCEREGVSAPVAGLRDAVRVGRGGVLFVEGEAGLRKSSASTGRGRWHRSVYGWPYARATRRAAALHDLSGEGVSTVRQRLGT